MSKIKCNKNYSCSNCPAFQDLMILTSVNNVLYELPRCQSVEKNKLLSSVKKTMPKCQQFMSAWSSVNCLKMHYNWMKSNKIVNLYLSVSNSRLVIFYNLNFNNAGLCPRIYQLQALLFWFFFCQLIIFFQFPLSSFKWAGLKFVKIMSPSTESKKFFWISESQN